jgi:peroxiredoxin
MPKIAAFVLMLVLLLCLAALTACSGNNDRNFQAGSYAADFTLDNLDRQPVSLGSLRGKAVFINFWATTCPPCVKEMPYIQELYLDWSSRSDVAVLTINNAESASTVKNFIQAGRYTFPVLLDAQLEVAQKYRIQYLPTSILVDRDGILQYRVIGPFSSKAAILKAMSGLLSPP